MNTICRLLSALFATPLKNSGNVPGEAKQSRGSLEQNASGIRIIMPLFDAFRKAPSFSFYSFFLRRGLHPFPVVRKAPAFPSACHLGRWAHADPLKAFRGCCHLSRLQRRYDLLPSRRDPTGKCIRHPFEPLMAFKPYLEWS